MSIAVRICEDLESFLVRAAERYLFVVIRTPYTDDVRVFA